MTALAQSAAIAAATSVTATMMSLGCHMAAEKMAVKKCEKEGIDEYSEEGYDVKAKYSSGARIVSAVAASSLGVAASYGIWQANNAGQQPVTTETVETENGGTVEVTTF